MCDNDGNLVKDHFAITCNIKLSAPITLRKTVHYRKVKEIDIAQFQNDIQSCAVLASLDLSAAFDTVDYAIFLRNLQNLCGIEQTALQWFGSYLTDRTHQVCINNTLSKSQFLKCGVP